MPTPETRDTRDTRPSRPERPFERRGDRPTIYLERRRVRPSAARDALVLQLAILVTGVLALACLQVSP